MSALNLKRYSYICNHTYNFKRHTVLEINTNFLFFILFKITPPLFYLLIFTKRSFHLSGEIKCLLSLFLRNYKRYKYKLLPMSLVHLETLSIYSYRKGPKPPSSSYWCYFLCHYSKTVPLWFILSFCINCITLLEQFILMISSILLN